MQKRKEKKKTPFSISMFYSDVVLSKKGSLAKVWLAAHWERKLSKSQFLQTNIQSSVGKISFPSYPTYYATSLILSIYLFID
jgi:hypothetical protein